MDDKKVDISRKYSLELEHIWNKINDLEQKRIYELTGYNPDGSLSTNIQQLRNKN